MTSIAFETLGASFEFRLMHVEEEVVEDGRIHEIVADQRSEEWQQRRLQTRMMTAKGRNVVQFTSDLMGGRG